jgi:hypothetical protein
VSIEKTSLGGLILADYYSLGVDYHRFIPIQSVIKTIWRTAVKTGVYGTETGYIVVGCGEERNRLQGPKPNKRTWRYIFYTWEYMRLPRRTGSRAPDTIFILDHDHDHLLQLWFDLVEHWPIVSLAEYDTVIYLHRVPTRVARRPLPFVVGALAMDVSGTIITQSPEYPISISNSTCTTGLCQCLSRYSVCVFPVCGAR